MLMIDYYGRIRRMLENYWQALALVYRMWKRLLSLGISFQTLLY